MLTPRAIIAYAVRCACRVRPLFTFEKGQHVEAVDAAIEIATRFSAGECDSSVELPLQAAAAAARAGAAAAAAVGLDAVATSCATAADAAAACASDGVERHTGVWLAAIAASSPSGQGAPDNPSAASARAAAAAARVAAASAFAVGGGAASFAVGAALASGIAVAHAVASATGREPVAGDAAVAVVAACADFDRLHALGEIGAASLGEPIDPSEQGPLGPVWPTGLPPGWGPEGPLQRELVIEAQSLAEARQLICSTVPKGFDLVAEEVLSGDTVKSETGIGDTIADSFLAAQRAIPRGAIIQEKKEIVAPSLRITEVIEFDERKALELVKGQLVEEEKIAAIELKGRGRHGFLGIGRRPDRYMVTIVKPAVVEVTYVEAAKIRIRIKRRSSGPVT